MAGNPPSWVHCNKCGRRVEKWGDPPLFISNCGHLLCRDCAHQSHGVNRCPICKGAPIQFLEIGNALPQNVQAYFRDITDELKETYQVLEFQRRQKKNLIAGLLEQLAKKERAYRELESHCKVAQAEAEALRVKLARRGGSNPAFHMASPQFERKAHHGFLNDIRSGLLFNDGHQSFNSSRSGNRRDSATMIKAGRLTLPPSGGEGSKTSLGSSQRGRLPKPNFAFQGQQQAISRRPTFNSRPPAKPKDNMFQKVAGWLNNIHT